MTRKRTPVNEILSDMTTDIHVHLPTKTAPAFWATKYTRLQLIRAIQVKGDQFVGTQGVSEIWLYPQGQPDSGHGYVVSDDARGLLVQLVAAGQPTQQAFLSWGNVAGVTERTAK